jgi:uncharacterized protein (DUF1697 family)
MTIYIALFRSMNVGNNRITMKEMVTLLEKTGCSKVRTYIQSGNAVFESPMEDPAALSALIGAEVQKCCGFQPYVLLLEGEEVRKAMLNNPFPEAGEDPKSLHLGFLASLPEHVELKALESLRSGSEQFRLIGKVFYLLAPEGVGRSKLAANAERLLGISMTDRNWNTVCAIMEMADQMSQSSPPDRRTR